MDAGFFIFFFFLIILIAILVGYYGWKKVGKIALKKDVPKRWVILISILISLITFWVLLILFLFLFLH